MRDGRQFEGDTGADSYDDSVVVDNVSGLHTLTCSKRSGNCTQRLLETIAKVVEDGLGAALSDLLGDVFQRVVVHAEQPVSRKNQSGELQATKCKEQGDEVAKPQVIEIIESIRQIVDVVVVEGQDFETLHASHLGREFSELVLVQVQLGKRQKLLEGMKASAKALPHN